MRKLAFLISCLFIVSCAPITETQKPLSPLIDKVEGELANLSRVNPTLAEELRKLPEIKTRLNEKGVLALNRIVTLYNESKNPEVKQVFERVLSIGKKERRKFSAPLQALFWVAEEQELPINENPLKPHTKEKYRGFNKHLGEDEEVITFVYNVWRKTFDTDKWEDPNEIMDRLSSPHLFDLFFRDNIAYDWDKYMMIMADRRYHETWSSYIQSAKVTIRKRKRSMH